MTAVFYSQGQTPTPEWLLMQYAAGTLPPYESMLIAAYLALNSAAKQQLARFEAEGGRMLEESAPVKVTGACLNNILAIIEPAGVAARPHPAVHAAKASDCPLPEIMRRLLSTHCPQQKLAWRRLAPGIARIDIQLCRTEPRQRSLALVRVDAGRAAPSHRHQGVEMTLVLEGSYQDGSRSYGAGEMVILGRDSVPHSPSAGAEGCVCMVLTEGAVWLQNPVLRWLSAVMPR